MQSGGIKGYKALGEGEKLVMGGRFGKYVDLKRKAALRKSRKEKGRLLKVTTPHVKRRRKGKRDSSQHPDQNYKERT
jgi:hypothetical protein